MKSLHSIVLTIVIATTLSANAQLSVSYPSLERSMADRLVLKADDIEQFRIKVSGKTNATAMSVDINFVNHDSIRTEQYIPVHAINADTIPDMIITTKTLGDSIKLIYSSSKILTSKLYPKPTRNSILMETPVTDSNSTTLPIFAITPGINKQFIIQGKKMEGMDYCSLRDSGIAPDLWHNKFDIPEYIYFTLNLIP